MSAFSAIDNPAVRAWEKWRYIRATYGDWKKVYIITEQYPQGTPVAKMERTGKLHEIHNEWDADIPDLSFEVVHVGRQYVSWQGAVNASNRRARREYSGV